ncbi:hypothetical protein BaRGS_00024628, partial [Batillaria attramentaria]
AMIANHHLNRKLNSLESFFTCGENVMVEVGVYLLATLAHLLVAVVIMAEALQFQQWVKLGRKAQLVVTMVLCLVAFVYVAVVLTTVFYKVTLADSKNPCDEYGYVNYSFDEKTWRAMPAVDYLVPTAAVMFAVVLLLIAYVSKSSTAAMTTTPGHLAFETNNPPMPARRQFPADAVLAGLVVVFFPFVFFFIAFAAWDLEPRMERSARWKLWAAGRLLGVLSLVLIPCCWLLDPAIRADWWRCCRGRPRADHMQDTPEPLGIQNAGYAEEYTRL